MTAFSDDTPRSAKDLFEFSLRVLIRTLLRCVLWFGAAWLITRFNPGIVWLWYVAWAFVAIGVGVSLLMLVLAFRRARRDFEE